MGKSILSPHQHISGRANKEGFGDNDEGERRLDTQRFQILSEGKHGGRPPQRDLKEREHQQLRIRRGQQEEAGCLQWRNDQT